MKLNRVFLASMMALAGAAMGCPGPSTTDDAGMMMSGDDTGMTMGDDAGMMTAQPVVQTGTMAMPVAPDYDCRGSNTAPTPGAAVMANVRVSVLSLMSFPAASAPIQIFPGSQIRAACDGDCIMTTTDSMGVANVSIEAGSWFGYRLPAGGTGMNTWVPSIGYFYTFPDAADGTTTVTAIGTVAASLVANGLNRELTADSSAVSGSVTDCDGNNVANVAIRMFRGSSEICPGGCPADDTTMPRITGLSDATIPARSPDGLTRFAGRFAGILPAAGGPVRIEAYGSLTEGAAPVLLGCEEVLVEGNTVTIAVIPPLRNDYPAGHACMGRM
ncbi:MAG: hypothetical protein OHK0013_07010 [Sandaracinaceae bacterium]